MSINKMLIDATHPEETRVVVLRENRVEEFDYESAARKLLRGSIYLAKITRVEPSLQASFVDYGGNRHGFLAFAEIHPDYYQIPHADKMALLEQESRDQAAYDEELDAADDADEAENAPQEAATDNDAPSAESDDNSSEAHDFEANAIDVSDYLPAPDDQPASNDDTRADSQADSTPSTAPLSAADAPENIIHSADDYIHISANDDDPSDSDPDDNEENDEQEVVESLNDGPNDDDETVAAIDEEDDDDDVEEIDASSDNSRTRRPRPQRPRRRARQYKIQEVIKRRQIVLIQVVKEERGNKGAALTTYLSLAGRYTVLMPNTARGGGISRKITNIQDRKRLKTIAQELEVPEGMGLIIRTAGAARTKQEIKRDFEYLLRLWENVRNLTLESTAPSLVYEEGNLIKRSIRDLYTKEIDEVVVAGEQAHKEAKGFMRMLMPSHARNVISHEDSQSLFAKFRIEQQLNQMFSPNVQLKSGGYLVINQTEALVAIDVNSGKSTREFSIEETALNTNLEAAEELSRQLKLRDLAGLIVVDFIDMEEKRNNRAVERRLKDSLRADRARIQVGRISHFGLLEMSRQRLRTGVLEGSTTPCEHCQGSGIVRSIESVSLAVLRGLEDTLVAGKVSSCVANCSADVALYLLNQKRAFIQELEERYGVVIHVRSSSKQQGASYAIEPLNDVVVDRPRRISRDAVNIDTGFTSDRVAANDDQSDEPAAETKPRRRRRRRGRRDENNEQETTARDNNDEVELADNDDTANGVAANGEAPQEADREDGADDRPRRSRRRGRRGGRRHREQRNDAEAGSNGHAAENTDQPSIESAEPMANGSDPADTAPADTGRADTVTRSAEPVEPETPAPTADASPEAPAMETVAAKMETINQPPATESEPAAPEPEVADRSARSQPVASEPVIQRVVVSPTTDDGSAPDQTPEAPAPEKAKPSRRGWWQRQFGG